MERFVKSTLLLCPIKNGNLFNRLGHYIKKVFGREWAVKSYLYKAHLFSLGNKIVNGFFGRLGYRTHSYDYAFGIGSSMIVEWPISSSRQGRNLLHIIGNYFYNIGIEFIGGFCRLKINIGVLGCSFGKGMLRIHCRGTPIV